MKSVKPPLILRLWRARVDAKRLGKKHRPTPEEVQEMLYYVDGRTERERRVFRSIEAGELRSAKKQAGE